MIRKRFGTWVDDNCLAGQPRRLIVEVGDTGNRNDVITNSWLDGVQVGDLSMLACELGEDRADRLRIEALEFAQENAEDE